MEKKVIDLEIIDDMEESGTQRISLVDSPAIEKDWMYFKKVEQFVTPESGESESDYMGRCVPTLIDEGKDQDQAVAICISTYENMGRVFEFDAFADYPWDECIADSEKRGLDPDSAARLCGWIKANMEINTSGLSPYVQQVDKKKKDLVTKPVNMQAIVDKAKTLGFSAEDFTTNGLEFHKEYEGIDLKLAKGYTVYKYEGPINSDSRDFCRQMVGLDRFYTFEEISQLSQTDPNPGFGLGGSDNYSIWKYLGGPNCHHFWQKFYVTEEGAVQNKGKAPGTPGTPMVDRSNSGYAFAEVGDLKVGDAVSWKTADQNPRGRIRDIVYEAKTVPGTDFKIEGTETDPGYIIEIYEEVDGKWNPTDRFVGRKADSILKNVELRTQNFATVEDKKELVGIVAIPDMEIYRKDKQGNPYYVKFSKDVIRRMAEKFMREQRLSDTNIGHEDVNADSYVYESWVIEHEGDKANTVYGLDAPIGSWAIKMKVVNPSVWAQVKAGKLRGFSLEGEFLSKEEYDAYMKDKQIFKDLISLVSSL
jgi:hypothetical protein